jgi:hypothetical protein
MPIYLWENKILIRSEHGDKVARHIDCCCSIGPYCKFTWRNTYNCDLDTWQYTDEAAQLVSAECVDTDPGDTGWVYNAGDSTDGFCVYDRVTSKPYTCVVSPPGTECDTAAENLTSIEIPDIPLDQDLLSSCPCFTPCGGDCLGCPDCVYETATNSVLPRVYGEADGTCNQRGCIYTSFNGAGGTGGGCLDFPNADIQCCGNVWGFSDGLYTYTKRGGGCGEGIYKEVDGLAPDVEVSSYPCDSFLIEGDGQGNGGIGCGGLTDGAAVNLAAWQAAGCPSVFGTDIVVPGMPFCFDITGGVVTPNYGFPTVSGITEYLDCTECLSDGARLVDGGYYIIDYTHYTASPSCSGTFTDYFGACCEYNMGQFWDPNTGVYIGTTFGGCTDQGDGTSTQYWGFHWNVVPGPYYFDPTCGGWTP